MAELIVTTPGRTRLRRLRRTRALRNLVAETSVAAEQLIMPHFVLPLKRGNEPISSMPGIAQQGLENVVKRSATDLELGIRAVLLFGHPEHGGKTPDGAAAAAANGAVQRACERLKREFGDELVVMTDVCLCAYTDHGHCGMLEGRPSAERRVARAARRNGGEPCTRRRRRRRAFRHDGRPRRGDPRRSSTMPDSRTRC